MRLEVVIILETRRDCALNFVRSLVNLVFRYMDSSFDLFCFSFSISLVMNGFEVFEEHLVDLRGACLLTSDMSVVLKRDKYVSSEVGVVEYKSEAVISFEKDSMSMERKARVSLVVIGSLRWEGTVMAQ